MTLLPSLIYIKEKILDYPDNPDYIFENEIQRIIDSKDKYSIKSLKSIVQEALSNNCWTFWRTHIKHSDRCSNYNIEEEITKEFKAFWINYKNLDNLDIE
jgi:hypothetical protein